MLRTLFVVAGILLAAALANPVATAQGTYYLSPSGSDARGDGSRDNPWKTIRHATNEIPDNGSTIVLLDGLYEGSQSVARRFENTCTIAADNPYRARLRSPQDSNRAFTIYKGKNLVFRGLEIFGSGATERDYLVHISTDQTEQIAFIDCIIHDSYRNDLIKVNDHAAINAADPATMPPDDILGNPRGDRPTVGCFER